MTIPSNPFGRLEMFVAEITMRQLQPNIQKICLILTFRSLVFVGLQVRKGLRLDRSLLAQSDHRFREESLEKTVNGVN